MVALVTTLAVSTPAVRSASSAAASVSVADVYQFAGECMRLRDVWTGRYVAHEGLAYALKPVAGATPFRMQATDLGSYLLYGPGGHMPSNFFNAVIPGTDANAQADWALTPGGAGVGLTNLGSGLYLGVTWFGHLSQDATVQHRWAFEPATGCPVFPEVEVNVSGDPVPGAASPSEVRGFLDAHVHLTAFDFLGGKFHCGRPWSRYGVADALKDCPDHIFDGAFAVAENLLSHGSLFGTHSEDGWPNFDGWPKYDSQTHEGTYWKAVERAWRGGLRIMVSDLVENRALCELYPLKQNPCTDTASIRLQAEDLYKLQDYIDAQSKGPGKGFFRIVKSPAEARAVIGQGKLAVVIGVETSQPFDCLYQHGVELCSQQRVDAGLQEMWDLGVRSLFMVHKFDNAFGGTAMDDGTAGILVNFGNKWMTGRWWDVESCPTGEHDSTPPSLGPALAGAPAGPSASPFAEEAARSLYSDIIEPLLDGPLPSYPAGNLCNVRGMTPLGEYLLNRMIDLGMIVETDHLSVKTRRRAMEILESRGYSGIVTSHSWGDDTSRARLQALGGIVAPHVNSGREGFIAEWLEAKAAQPAEFYFGIGFGSDMNGLSNQASPRPDALTNNPVTYPFTTIHGLAAFKNRWGNRIWDFNLDGAAHYGLYADWVEDMRHVGGNAVVDDLARGAEAYLQMWQRAFTSAAGG